MANRVTADEVKDIIDTELTNARIDTFITGANQIVTEVLGDENLGSDLLKEIERWLAAHYIAATFERQAIEQEAGPVSQKFSDIFGPDLQSSTYGQTASQLDSTNKLDKLGQKTISMIAVDEDYS